jgi:flavin reductase (DIM6/NTAB) family NADH-FMN oxidoreductase RutF
MTGTKSDAPPPLAHAALRRTLALFATGVTVITAPDPDSGEPRGMTANAFLSGSLEPPLVMVSVRDASHMRAAVTRSGSYGVSFLPEGLEREARRFAGMPVGRHESPPTFHEHGGVPVLGNCLGWLTAEVQEAHPIGDHTLFVGKVTEIGVDRPDDPPLLYHRSSFARLAPSEFGPIEIDAWGGTVDLWG